MILEELIFEILIGILLIFLGIQIGWKNKVELLHSYHRQNILENDLKAFARKMGAENILMGIGVLLMPALNGISGTDAGYPAGLAVMLFSFLLMVFTVIKYNGSLFGSPFFRKRKK